LGRCLAEQTGSARGADQRLLRLHPDERSARPDDGVQHLGQVDRPWPPDRHHDDRGTRAAGIGREAITDPIPGQGWYDDTHGEIGDVCAWKTKKLGAYTIQLEWSNAAGKCV
jgi:hypothetical protein